jgi:uncharacterized protein YybS (DUF2232 family)
LQTRLGNWFWISIYSILLICLLTPFSPFLIHFMMVPLVVLFSKFKFSQTVIPFLLILAMYSFINVSIGLFMFVLTMFLFLPALLMGKFNREQKHAGVVIFTGFLTILVQLIGIIVISFSVYDFNLIHWLLDQLEVGLNSLTPLMNLLLPEVNYAEQIGVFLALIKTIFTSILLIFSLYLAWISYMISRWILAKQGTSLPPFLPIRDWHLPRSLIWYNIIAIFLGFIVDDRTSFLFALHMNMFVLLLLVFWVQGISFLFFYCFQKKLPSFLPMIAICASVFSPILYLFSLVGLLDLLFPIRKRMTGQL